MHTPPQAPSGRPGAPIGTPPGPGTVRRPGIVRPLPDPVAAQEPGPIAVRLCRVPDLAPPYDDEEPPRLRPARAGEIARSIIAGLDRAADQPPDAGARPAGDPEPSEGGARSPSPPPGGQPDVWPSRFAQVLAETLAGSRPPAQLAPWTTERARTHIRRLGPMLAAGKRPFVQRIVTSLPASGVVEMSVVVGCGPRVRALAVRLERVQPRAAVPGQPPGQARWLCTAVEAA